MSVSQPTSLPNEVTNLKANLLLSQFIDDKLNYHQAATAASKRLRVEYLDHYKEIQGFKKEYLVLTTIDANRSTYLFRLSGRTFASETDKKPNMDIYKAFDLIESVKDASSKFNAGDKRLAIVGFSTEQWPVYLYEIIFLLKTIIDFPIDLRNSSLLNPDFAAGLTVEMSKCLFKGVLSENSSCHRGWWQMVASNEPVSPAEIMEEIKLRYEKMLVDSGLKKEEIVVLNVKMLNALMEGHAKIQGELQSLITAVPARELESNNLNITNTLEELDKRQAKIEGKLQALELAMHASGVLNIKEEEERGPFDDVLSVFKEGWDKVQETLTN